MAKAVFLVGALLLAGCSPADQSKTREDTKKLGQDLKHDVAKADAVVTKELKDARVKVQKGAHELKNDLNRPKQEP